MAKEYGDRVNFARCSFQAHLKRGFKSELSEQEVMFWVARHGPECDICGKPINWHQKARGRDGPDAPTIDVFGQGKAERMLALPFMRLVHYRCNIKQGDAGSVPTMCALGKL
jgi:hypothetical protein